MRKKIKYFEDDEYMEIVKDIIEHEEFQKRKNFVHHGEVNVCEHCLKVSYHAYKMAKRLHADPTVAAIGGLLHDFYSRDWHICMDQPFFQKHGFVHAREACDNAEECFDELLNKRIKNCIKRHMFPLNPIPPRYLESWIVTMIDKKVSLEIFKNPSKLPSYLGIK